MRKTVLIMAGGKGERFWPKSRISLPKQFLCLTDDKKSMIRLTVERILRLTDYDDIFIATGEMYKDLVRKHLPEIPEENIICEPEGKNTAPCIGLGAAHIYTKYADQADDTVMMVLPSDHLVKQDDIFVQTLEAACDTAYTGDKLVTIGITPTYAETGYGYIRFEKNRSNEADPGIPVYPVREFAEKPDADTAAKYLEDGRFLWNSGMFIWRMDTIRKAFKKYLPDTFENLERIRNTIGSEAYEDTLRHEFADIGSESVDYGIMEKADNIFILPGRFGWDDVGSWPSLARVNVTDPRGNLVRGQCVLLDTDNCIIENIGTNITYSADHGDFTADNPGDRLVAVLGMKDTVVVNTDDVVLVAQKDKCGDIKKLLQDLRNADMERLL